MAAPVRSAVVVGAGVAGLAAAGALARERWQVTLLERADRLRAEPTAWLLWPAGVRALAALGVGAGLDAISTPVPDRGVRRPDGRWLVQPGRDTGTDPVLVHAEDLHDALVAGLGDRVEVKTGVTVRRVADGCAVTDGRTSWAGELVVLADGVDSTLRPAVDQRCRVVSAGASSWRAVIPWYRAPELSEELAAGGFVQADGYEFFSAPLGPPGGGGGWRSRAGSEPSTGGATGRGGLYWRATVTGAARPEPAQTQLGLLRRWFQGWPAPIEALLAATEPDDLVQRELRMLEPAPRRYAVPRRAGALVLLGDAGHALTEQLGQGACLALEDAASLVAAVREAAPGEALHAAVAGYDTDRRGRVAQVRRTVGRLRGGGPLSRIAAVRARRRDRAAATVTDWHPPVG